MAVDVSKLIITEVAQITAFNNAGELEFIMDEVQNGSIKNSQEKSDITGRNGRKIASLKKNKAVTVSATNGVLVGGALAAQTGSEVEQGTFRVRITDVMTVKDNACKTTKTAVGVTGAEIGTIYVKNANGSLGTKPHILQGFCTVDGICGSLRNGLVHAVDHQIPEVGGTCTAAREGFRFKRMRSKKRKTRATRGSLVFCNPEKLIHKHKKGW